VVARKRRYTRVRPECLLLAHSITARQSHVVCCWIERNLTCPPRHGQPRLTLLRMLRVGGSLLGPRDYKSRLQGALAPYPISRGAHARRVARLMSCTYCGGIKKCHAFSWCGRQVWCPIPRPSDKPSVECKMMPAGEDYVPMSISMSKPGHWDISGSPVVRLCKSLFRRQSV
jgi:hypothetical protein